MPEFNLLTGKQLSLTFTIEWALTLIGIALFTGLMAGSYPALYLSGISPIHIFRGGLIKSLSTLWARKGLVIFQFMISLILIIMTFAISTQINYIQTKNLGYDKENVVCFNEPVTIDAAYQSFKSQLSKIPGVTNISTIRGDMTSGDRNNTTNLTWEGKAVDDEVDFSDFVVDYQFFKTMGIPLKESRSFLKS